MIKIFGVLALLILVFVTTNCAKKDDRGYLVKVGDMAPDFKMNLTNGEQLHLSDLKGKVVMLQFTASWCGVCIKEMPHIEKDIWEKYKNNKEFALYAIDRDEPLEKVLPFIEKTKVTYPFSLDLGSGIFELYAKKDAGITRNIILDRNGKIIFLTRLYNTDEFEAMKEVIEKELKK